MKTIQGLTISESTYKLEGGDLARLAVLIYIGSSNPKEILDLAVLEYTQGNMFHELIDANLDNPWMRVILSDINNIRQVPFDFDFHKINREIR